MASDEPFSLLGCLSYQGQVQAMVAWWPLLLILLLAKAVAAALPHFQDRLRNPVQSQEVLDKDLSEASSPLTHDGIDASLPVVYSVFPETVSC